ncbi:MAG: M15 family metallopeptidase, partial [Achromobacter piechaudii]
AFADLAGVVKACAVELGVPVEWGGDWKSFKDEPHFQIPRDWMGRA